MGGEGDSPHDAGGVSNTVIGCVVINARLRKPLVCRVADHGHTGIARAVSPAYTSLDGDALFALAIREVEAMAILHKTAAYPELSKAVALPARKSAGARGEGEGGERRRRRRARER